MEVVYKTNKLENKCTKLVQAKRNYPEKIAKKLMKLINFIDTADTLADIQNNDLLYFHALTGDKKGLYAMDIDGRRSSYRLIVTFDGFSNMEIFEQASSITIVQVEEVSNHYE